MECVTQGNLEALIFYKDLWYRNPSDVVADIVGQVKAQSN